MSITLSPSQLAWVNLPSAQRARFENIAAKDGDPDMDAYDWFKHLVPEPIQDQPEMVDVFMDGGTVTKEVYVHDQGRAGGHYEQVEYDIADKDVSRIQSGANGGEYTTDNTIMEDASANRSRGGEDMTQQEYQDIQTSNQVEADILNDAEVIEVAQSAPIEASDVISNSTAAASDASIFTDLGEALSDAVAPAIGAYIVGKAVANRCKTTEDKLGYGSLAAGGAALACMTPIGQTALACYGIYSLGKLALYGIAWGMNVRDRVAGRY